MSAPQTTFANPPATLPPAAPAVAQEPEDDGPSDLDLARRAEAGDRAAFGELHRRHSRALTIAVHKYFPKSPDLRDDAAQAAWFKAWRNVASFTYGSFRTWLLRIGQNEAITLLRRARKTLPLDATGVPEPVEEVPTGEANEDLKAALAACIDELLDADEREFLRKRVADNGYDDLLAADGIAPGHGDYKNARGRLYGRFNRIKDRLTTCVEGKLR